jgi:hypothetical protein
LGDAARLTNVLNIWTQIQPPRRVQVVEKLTGIFRPLHTHWDKTGCVLLDFDVRDAAIDVSAAK